jgi:Ca2+-binding RTX toxin-like protein
MTASARLFESLEKRTLMSAGNGTAQPLVINGTNAADTIIVSQSGEIITVNVNGVVTTHDTYRPIYGSAQNVQTGAHVITKVVIHGKGGNDTIKGNESVKKVIEVFGGAGSDSIVGGFKKDKLYGGANQGGSTENGNDTLEGGWDDDELHASYNGGGTGACVLRGGFGSDTLKGGAGNDTLHGEHGYDSIVGMSGNDSLLGGVGNDKLNGSAGNDKLEGGDNEDSLNGSVGNDTMWGQNGYDHMSAEDGADFYSGGADLDTITYESRTTGQTIKQDGVNNDGNAGEGDNVSNDIETVYGTNGNDTIIGGFGKQKLYGLGGDDVLRAGVDNDTVYGGAGDDRAWGDTGNDVLIGEADDDSLWGGAGDDTSYGGAGDDTIVSIGGGTKDKLNGEAGFDGFWLDTNSSETHDASGSESSSGNVHRVGGFMFGTSKEANGQDLPDPVADDGGAYDPNRHRLDGNPLFRPSTGIPMMTDVNQGNLGDCYFLAGMGAVARQQPNIIKQSIVELGDDTYAVRFERDGETEYYRIDNELPATFSWTNGMPTYTGQHYAQLGGQNAMWVALLEKAFVFWECGADAEYGVIGGGFGDYGYDALGLSSWTKDTDDDDAMAVIAQKLAQGKPVDVCTSFSLNGFDLGDSIVLNHCYTVVSINQQAKTITLYNPWGTDAGSGSGAWVQNSNDGYVTYSWQSFVDHTAKFYIANV